MRNLFLFLLLITALQLPAQDSSRRSSRSVAFYSITQVGLLEGQAGSAFQVQTVNGITSGPWHAGIGLGIDKYGIRSLPVFAQVQYRLPVVDRSFSVYLDGGRSYTWLEPEQEQPFNDQRNGWYWDAGLQYHWRGKRGAGPVFSLGYSEKSYGWEYNPEIMCIRAPCPGYQSSYQYLSRRIALKAGFKL